MLPNSRSAIVFVILALPSLLAPASAQTFPNTEAYPLLDHVQGTLVQTAAAPVRPVLIDAAFEVWAVNTDLGTVERFGPINQEPLPTNPLDIRHVPWGPVSIAEWDDPSPSIGPELLVVCRNTWGLLRMDKASGAYKEFIPLPAEPSDVVVDSANRAFVSCTGADAVVRIDLLTRDGKFHGRYDESTTGGALQIKSPYFLSFDGVSGLVFVAPLHSGNNTTTTGVLFQSVDQVISLAGRTNALPDKDLFAINPGAPEATAVTTAATGVGTILFAHGRNPLDLKYWVLNTEALNTNEVGEGEPDLNFDFVDNRATLLGAPHAFVGFDLDSGAPFSEANAIGQPFALAFHPGTGRAFVAGLLTDNVTMFSAAGAHLVEIDLDPGSIPRGLALASADTRYLAVYCWGTARIEAYRIDHPGTTPVSLGGFALSHDPLPEDLQEGRQIFFDGHRSARKNVSCASCHVDGGTDFLAWNLSGLPFDDKGPMVTQTLIGLERVSPFHWRGERTMEDFNTFGFPALLGNPGLSGEPEPLPEEEFEKMKAWLFALKNPANPFQNRDRVVDNRDPGASPSFVAPTQIRRFRSDLTALVPLNDEHPLLGEQVPANAEGFAAVEGMRRWQGLVDPSDIAFEGRWACVQCHAFPVGTNNDVTDDELQANLVIPERMHFKNAPFHELWRKKQSLVPVDATVAGSGPIDVRAFLGTGVAHAGAVPDVLRFAQVGVNGNSPEGVNFALTAAPFLQQWDQGLAPAAHFAYWLSSSSTNAAIAAELDAFLLTQASDVANSTGIPNCDIAVIQFLTGSRRTWFLDRDLVAPGTLITRSNAVFRDDSDLNGTNDNASLSWFISQAKPKHTMPPIPSKPSLILGLPVGMAERFVADYDMDRKKNLDEPGTMFTVDTTDDLVNPEIESTTLVYVSTNTARVIVHTDEPTTLTVLYRETTSPDEQTVTSDLLSRVHALILPNLRPSTSDHVPTNDDDPVPDSQVSQETVAYHLTVKATDASGRMDTDVVSNAIPSTGSFSIPMEEDQPVPGNPSEVIGTPVAQMRHEHVLTSPPLVNVFATGGDGNRDVTVNLSASLKQGQTPKDPAERRVFVVRAFRIRGTDAPVLLTVANGGVIESDPLTTRIIGGVAVSEAGGGGNQSLDFDNPGPPFGRFLIVNASPTDAAGAAILSFKVGPTQVDDNDEVVVQVEAVIESTTTPPQFIGCGPAGNLCFVNISVPSDKALSQWDFPRTGEVNSQGRGTAPPSP